MLDTPCGVQVQLTTGATILPRLTSIGYAGFNGEDNTVALKFVYPYKETPKRYIRKLMLIGLKWCNMLRGIMDIMVRDFIMTSLNQTRQLSPFGTIFSQSYDRFLEII